MFYFVKNLTLFSHCSRKCIFVPISLKIHLEKGFKMIEDVQHFIIFFSIPRTKPIFPKAHFVCISVHLARIIGSGSFLGHFLLLDYTKLRFFMYVYRLRLVPRPFFARIQNWGYELLLTSFLIITITFTYLTLQIFDFR